MPLLRKWLRWIGNYDAFNFRYNIVTGGTDCHIVHVDLKRSPVAISGAKGELILEEVCSFTNLILMTSLFFVDWVKQRLKVDCTLLWLANRWISAATRTRCLGTNLPWTQVESGLELLRSPPGFPLFIWNSWGNILGFSSSNFVVLHVTYPGVVAERLLCILG